MSVCGETQQQARKNCERDPTWSGKIEHKVVASPLPSRSAVIDPESNYGFDEARSLRIVTQGSADFPDSGVDVFKTEDFAVLSQAALLSVQLEVFEPSDHIRPQRYHFSEVRDASPLLHHMYSRPALTVRLGDPILLERGDLHHEENSGFLLNVGGERGSLGSTMHRYNARY